MSTARSAEYLTSLVRELCNLSKETEWVEFKVDNTKPEEIGEYISALANAAALAGKAYGYLVWGVDDGNQDIIGTRFSPAARKIGNEELENWLLRLLTPKLHLCFFTVEIAGHPVVLLEIERAFRHPVRFRGVEYIRVGSYKKKLKDFPEMERALWRVLDQTPFEDLVEIDRFLDTPPKSRNEALASLARRIGICEERGSGIDKVVFQTELHQLPAPAFEQAGDSTRATLFAQRPLSKMDKADRIRACYLHACLRYVNRDYMTNSTLRQRFGIDARNSATASRYIKEALEAGMIRLYDEDVALKLRKYVPFWA